TIQEKIGEAPNDSHFHKKAFHTNIFRALNDLPSSKENLIRFWHSVVFFNYVQDSVGERARIRPKEELWELSYESVKKTLDILKPEIIIVLGYKLWDSINYKFKPFE